MADPFAVLQAKQVSIPELYGLYAKNQALRVEALYKAKEAERADRKAQREDDERAALADVFADKPAPRPSPYGPLGVVQPLVPKALPPGESADANRPSSQGPGIGGVAGAMGIGAPKPQPTSILPAGLVDTTAPSELAANAAPADRAEPGGLTINPEGLRRLAKLNPEMALKLSKVDDDQRAAAFKAIKENVEFESQIIGSVRRVPEAQRPEAYARIRAALEAKGVKGLPPEWDEQHAETLQAMGLTAMQAFQDDRAERRFAWDRQDDEADNERADRNTNDLIHDRAGRRGLIARGQNLTDTRVRRGQDLDSTDRRRGQDLSATRYRPGHRPASPASLPTATDPKTGHKVQWNGRAWVPLG